MRAYARSHPSTDDEARELDCSHAVRLSGRQWIVVGVAVLALMALAPAAWERFETFEPGTDYRLPYDLSNDYWLYRRHAERVGRREKIAVVGDSVIWGHYVAPDQTLAHHLNELAGDERFANLGLDGTHPAALYGLLQHYADRLSGTIVVIHFNPLWITSEKHDLQTVKEFHFNHPKLVPQFKSGIPCYRASFSQRLWAAVQQRVPFYAWTAHIRTAYYDSMAPQQWTLEHPYERPLPVPEADRLMPAQDRRFGGEPLGTDAKKQDVAWVDLKSSLQWRFFRRSIALLKQRGNDVFVLVGPFNEHALSDRARQTYDEIKGHIETWLRENDIAHLIAPPLPADLYVDTSHPIAQGYAMLAKQLLAHPWVRQKTKRSE